MVQKMYEKYVKLLEHHVFFVQLFGIKVCLRLKL